MPFRSAVYAALAASTPLLAGCANNDNLLGPNALTTATVGPQVDPACYTLSSKIETLRKEGVADKIEKAAAKKYKMTAADLAKADQLTKADAEFQTKCSTLPAKPQTAQPEPDGSEAKVASAKAGSSASAKAQPAPAAVTVKPPPKQ